MILGLWEGADTFDILRDKTNNAITYLMTLVGVPVGGELEYKGSPGDASLWDSSGIGVSGTMFENFALCLGQGLTGSLLKNYDGTDSSVAPDKRGKFSVGYDPSNAKFPEIGSMGGSETVTLTANQSGLRDHNHPYTSPTGSGGAIGGSGSWLQGSANTGNVKNVDGDGSRNGPQGALESHENLPPYMATGFIIRYK